MLNPEEIEHIQWSQRDDKVDFGLLYQNRLKVLRQAYSRFQNCQEFEQFCIQNGSWLSDFSLYMALKEKFQGAAWYEWEPELKFRNPDAIWKVRCELREEVHFYQFVQYLFHKQWTALRDYAHSRGVQFIGDVPIYVPYDSVDAWSNPELFQFDEKLNPVEVAGCPPDGFSEDGQLWGNPLYRWDVLAQDGYSWWLRRLAAAGELYDVIRLDHFRGFESYWAVPFGDTTARGGHWVKGPGMGFVEAVKTKLPHIRLIAEDLGFLTQAVLDLRDESGFPGMKVLGFAFDSREPSAYLPHKYIRNTVCYTGTHDNMTMRQWFETAFPDAVAYAAEYMRLTEEKDYVWGTIQTAMSSVSDLCIIQMQDYLDLGGEARMNFPGTLSDANWTWRVKDGMINDTLAQRILQLTKLYDRMGQKADC